MPIVCSNGRQARAVSLRSNMRCSDAYFTRRENISDAVTLRVIAERAGWTGTGPPKSSPAMRSPTRCARPRRRIGRGVAAVPTIIVDGRYQINGAQPTDRFAKAFRHIIAERAAA